MALTTYALLKTAIADFLNRTDLTSAIPTFIELAEASFRRREEFQDEFRTTITLSSAAVTLPATVREVTSLYMDSTSYRGPIEMVSPEQLSIRKGLFGYQGAPQLAAVSGDGTELLLAPEPTQSYEAQVIYLLKLVSLSDAAPSNWLLTDHPDLYLYGSLMESAPYLQDDGRVEVWERRMEKAAAELRAMLERRRFSPNTPVLRPRQAIG